MTQGHCQDFVHQIDSSPGIYFDPIGELKINVGHLDIVTAFDISYIEPHINNINSILGTTRHLCNQIQFEISESLECTNILEPLTIRYNDMVSEYSSIAHLVNNRFKRSAWIGGIGSLAKTIFGTLDENDAIKYDNAIRNIQDNEKRIASLIKENVLVTTSSLLEFNNTIYKIKLNEISLSEAIDKFSISLKNLTIISNTLNIKSKINSILNSLEASILTLSFQLQDITNAIMLTSNNILHPAILRPTQLYQELVDNYRYLPVDFKLPVNLELSQIHILTNISNVICYTLRNKLVFVLRIPLVSPKEYSLFHNIPLPIPHKNTEPDSFSFIIPSTKYIAMTRDKSEYCTLESLQECRAITRYNYICDVMSVFPTSANPNCESEIMCSVISVLPKRCKTEFIYGNLDIWKPLHNNKWIFVQSQKNKLYIECPNKNIAELNIFGTGIVNIPINCIAYCKTTKLIPKLNNLSLNITIVKSDFNIINDSCCSLDNFKYKIKNESPIQLNNLDLDIFTSESKSKFQSITSEADKIINQHPIIQYGTHYSIVTIVIVCIILLFCIVKIYSIIKSHNRFSFTFPRFSPPAPVESPPEEIPIPEIPIPVRTTESRSRPKDIPSPSLRTNI